MIRLKEILEKQHLSQRWLAERCGFSVQSVNNWCQQKNEPSLKTLALIAKVLKVKIADLIIEENLKK
jgi:putative transcriptional regulator